MATLILVALFAILLTGVAAVLGVGLFTICCGVRQVVQAMLPAAPAPQAVPAR